MPLSDIIDVQVRLGAPPVSRAGFGTIGVAGENVDFDEPLRFYTSPAAMLEDAEANLSASDPQYIEGAAAFSANIRPSRIALIQKGSGQSWVDALTAARAASLDWYGLVATTAIQADIAAIAAWAEADGRTLYIARSHDAGVIQAPDGDIGTVLASASYNRTALLYRTPRVDAQSNPVHDPAAATWAADRLSVDPDEQTTIWSYVTLPGIPFDRLSSTEQGQILARNANLYTDRILPVGTAPGTLAGGRKLDTQITVDWSAARLSEDIAQLIQDASVRGSKLPYTDNGIAAIESTVRARIEGVGVAAGHFVEGETVFDFPARADTSATDRGNRLYRFSAVGQLAGAIERVRFLFDLEV